MIYSYSELKVSCNAVSVHVKQLNKYHIRDGEGYIKMFRGRIIELNWLAKGLTDFGGAKVKLQNIDRSC
jgi:hypothetical protein